MNKFFYMLFPRDLVYKLISGSFFTVFIITLLPYFLSFYSKPFITLGFFCFYFMMHEDFYEHTIDMRLVAFLLVSFLLAVGLENPLDFLMIYIFSLAIIQSIRELTARSSAYIITSEKISIDRLGKTTIQSNEEEENSNYGWLPSFGISIILVLALTFILGDSYIPFVKEAGDGFDAFIAIANPQQLSTFVILLILSCLIWLHLVRRNHRKEKIDREIVYGFGDGDGYVFATFIAFFGLKYFLLILFLNLLLLAILGLPQYLSKKRKLSNTNL